MILISILSYNDKEISAFFLISDMGTVYRISERRYHLLMGPLVNSYIFLSCSFRMVVTCIKLVYNQLNSVQTILAVTSGIMLY